MTATMTSESMVAAQADVASPAGRDVIGNIVNAEGANASSSLLESAHVVIVEYKPELSAHSASYDDAVQAFGSEQPGDQRHRLRVPGSAIQAVIYRENKPSESAADPTIWLKIKTGLEPSVDIIEDGVIREDASVGRWVRFPLALAGFRIL